LTTPGTAAPPSPSASKRREQIPLGILYMIGATLLFAAGNAHSKWAVETYPPAEILLIRTLAGLATILLLFLPRKGLRVFHTRRIGAHAIRGISQTTSQTLIVIAFSLMPLAGAMAINFAAPLFATLAAAVFLREKVGLTRWLVLLVGFAGVLIITQPGTGSYTTGALFALGNAVLYGSVTAGVRGMTATESAETLTVYQFVFMSAFFTLMLPFGFVMPTTFDTLAIILNGVANAVGQYWWTRSLHLAPASAVTPFYYFNLVWALILGFLIWGDVPTWSLIIGSLTVVASGLFLLWWETAKRGRTTA
jgi:drug/metabolite transporter (DMT)-like permease